MRALPTTTLLLSASFFSGLLAFAPAARAAEDEFATLAAAIDANPDDMKAYDAYASKAVKADKFDEAIARLKVGVARSGDFPNGYYLLAYAYRKKAVWVDAADYYRRCIGLKHKENESYFGLGKSLAGMGYKAGAIGALRKYVTLASAAQATMAPEKRTGSQRFIDEANADIAKLEAGGPGAPGGASGQAAQLRAAADQLRVDKRFEEAAAGYKKAIEVDRKNLDLYNDLGNVYFALKRYNDAAQAFKDATAQEGNYALGWYNLATALRKAERKAEAVEAYRRYMKLKPDDSDPYYGLAQTLKALGDNPGALAAFRKYVEMEKRPDEQKWVEKARQELAAMEAMPKAASQGSPGSGKIDDK
ncbi:MAG: tetratricopeptide repeat protein [Myxococcales bacterium]|nr:tetratricopeptide repeat protein [Myxococcales bacterium]